MVLAGQCRIVLSSIPASSSAYCTCIRFTMQLNYFILFIKTPISEAGILTCLLVVVRPTHEEAHHQLSCQLFPFTQSVSQMKWRRWRCGSLWTSCDLGSSGQNQLFSLNRCWTSARPPLGVCSLTLASFLPSICEQQRCISGGTLLPRVMFHLSGLGPSHPAVSTGGPLTFSAWSWAPRQRWRHPGTPEGRRRGYEECKEVWPSEAITCKTYGRLYGWETGGSWVWFYLPKYL